MTTRPAFTDRDLKRFGKTLVDQIPSKYPNTNAFIDKIAAHVSTMQELFPVSFDRSHAYRVVNDAYKAAQAPKSARKPRIDPTAMTALAASISSLVATALATYPELVNHKIVVSLSKDKGVESVAFPSVRPRKNKQPVSPTAAPAPEIQDGIETTTISNETLALFDEEESEVVTAVFESLAK